MNIPVTISIPELWGNQTFQRNDWGFVNFLVGPNGTGKTLFGDKLRHQLQTQGLKPRYLNSERLAGLEKQSYGRFSYTTMERGLDIGQFQSYKSDGMNYGLAADAFVILREKLDVRLRIEATLSQLFGRRIRLAEEGGFLKPKLQKVRGGAEYGLRESECHGLKELITLLTFLYDDEYNCLIIDEPELHLHPQFQTLFLQEIRHLAGDPKVDPKAKCFFLITHSPYYIDVRTLQDLRNCLVFQPEKLPNSVDPLEPDDEKRIKRLLPRLNTHHKQFFFATRPIFVEGYFDQQLFSLIQEKRGKILGASGACIIDVGGKDELDVFFRLSKRLGIDAQIISDLDTVFSGRLRKSISEDERCKSYLQQEGLGVDLMSTIGGVERAINDCLAELEPSLSQTDAPNGSPLWQLREYLAKAKESERRHAFLVATTIIRDQIEPLISRSTDKLPFIQGRMMKIIEAFRKCCVYLLPRGKLENHLPTYAGNPYMVSDSDKLNVFETERDFILDANPRDLEPRYRELATILDAASRSNPVNLDVYLSYAIGDWIHRVQSAFVRGQVSDAESLKNDTLVEWPTYSRIFELLEFSPSMHGFNCRIKLKPLVDPREREIPFNETTVAASFSLREDDRHVAR
jgi:hypothetical protein